MFRKIILCFVLLILSVQVFNQSLSVGFFTSKTLSDMHNTVVNGKNGWNLNNDYLNISAKIPIKKWHLLLGYNSHKGSTIMPDPNPTTLQIGFTGAMIKRYETGVNYEFKLIDKLTFAPYILIGIQQSIKNIFIIDPRIDFIGDFTIQKTPFSSSTRNLNQITKAVGFKLNWKLKKKIILGIDWKYLVAKKSFQEVEYDYVLRSDLSTLRTAVYQTTGTGFYYCPFIEYRFKY